jgi:hypothetical protein
MFRFPIRTDAMTLMVSRAPTLKLDLDKRPKMDAATGWPLHEVEITALTDEVNGSVIMKVTVASPTPPAVRFRDIVDAVDLEILPWAQKSDKGELRSGVAFRATELRVLVPAQG